MGALGDDTIKRMRSIKKQNGYLDVSSDVAYRNTLSESMPTCQVRWRKIKIDFGNFLTSPRKIKEVTLILRDVMKWCMIRIKSPVCWRTILKT